MSNASRPSSDHVCFAKFQPWEEALTTVICGLVALLSAVDFVLTWRRFKFAFSMTQHFLPLLAIPALYAMTTVYDVFVTDDRDAEEYAISLVADLQAGLRSWFLYHHVLHYLTIFSARRVGGTPGNLNAVVEYVGGVLDELKVPRQKLSPPCCALFWCACGYTPGRAFLRSCIGRMNFVVWAALVVIIGRVMIHAADLSLHAETALNIWSILMIFVSLSCKMPLDALVEPLVFPSAAGRKTEYYRKMQFNIFFTLIGALHKVIAVVTTSIHPVDGDPRPCLLWVNHQNLLVSLELLVIAGLGHRCWVPPFVWGCSSTSSNEALNRTMAAAQASYEAMTEMMSSGEVAGHLALSDVEVADVLGKKASVTDARAGHMAGVSMMSAGQTQGSSSAELLTRNV